jgi:DNA-binding MarR family transcriptional regulator
MAYKKEGKLPSYTILRNKLEDIDFASGEASYLSMVIVEPGQTTTAIVDRTGISQQMVSTYAVKAEKRGIVEREAVKPESQGRPEYKHLLRILPKSAIKRLINEKKKKADPEAIEALEEML